MHTFKVVKAPHGWTVRLGHAMTAPFRSRALAIQEANCLCEDLLSHGVAAEVEIEAAEPMEPPRTAARFSSRHLAELLRNRLPAGAPR